MTFETTVPVLDVDKRVEAQTPEEWGQNKRVVQIVVLAASLLIFGCSWKQTSEPQGEVSLPDYCDKSLIPSGGNLQYRLRSNDRCEGLFESRTACASVEVFSLHIGDLNIDTSSSNPVYIMPAGRTMKDIECVHLRTVSRFLPSSPSSKANTHYRMDVNSCTGTFLWPIHELAQTSLTADDIGVYGLVENNHQQEYVPLIVTQWPMTLPTGALPEKLVLRSCVFLDQLSYRVFPDIEWHEVGPVEREKTVTIALPKTAEPLVKVVVQPYSATWGFYSPLSLLIRTAT